MQQCESAISILMLSLPPSWAPLPSHLSRSSQSTGLSSLCCTTASQRLSVLHVCSVASVGSDSFLTPWTVARQTPLPMGFSRQECWSGLPFPPPGDLPDPGIEPEFPAWQADSLPHIIVYIWQCYFINSSSPLLSLCPVHSLYLCLRSFLADRFISTVLLDSIYTCLYAIFVFLFLKVTLRG